VDHGRVLTMSAARRGWLIAALVAYAIVLVLAITSPAKAATIRAQASDAQATLMSAAHPAARQATARHHLKWYVLKWAETQAGDPYVYGGAGPNSYDCSGLVMRAWSRFGKSLPHNTVAMLGSGRLYHVAWRDRAQGDLLFWGTSHVEFVTQHGSFGAHHTGTLVGWRGLYGTPSVYRVR